MGLLIAIVDNTTGVNRSRLVSSPTSNMQSNNQAFCLVLHASMLIEENKHLALLCFFFFSGRVVPDDGLGGGGGGGELYL